MSTVNLKSYIQKVQSSLMWDYRIPIDKIDAEKLITKDRRVLCSINNTPAFSCALTPDGNKNFYIHINKETRSKLSLEVGDKVQIHLVKDESKYGIPLPPSFKELLIQDPEGERLFDALTPGKRRSLLYVIDKPKSEQKQLEKGLIILDYLKEVNGNLDFKELIIAFKSNRYK